jgi:AcrR family transcriptional regulator
MSAGAGRARQGETAARVLDAALELFEEHSSIQIRVKSLCARSGVSVGSIYHHFGGMEGVSAALYSRCMDGLLGRILESVGKRDRVAPLVRALVAAYLDWTEENPAAARFIHASAFAPYYSRFQAAIAGAKQAHMEKLAALIDSQARAGAIVRMPGFLYEMLIIGPVAEAARRWLAGMPGIDLAAARRILPARILESISSRK